jgi:ribonuclease III
MVEDLQTASTSNLDDGGVSMKAIFPRNMPVSQREIETILRKNNVRLKINDITLYQRAFSHKSYAKKKKKEGDLPSDSSDDESKEESNERLEFVGDSILSGIVANYLFDRFPDQDEGFLTRMRTKLVRGRAPKDRPNDPCLAKFAEYLKLSKYILLSKHVDQVCHGRRSKKIMEDAFESLIGAIYKDFSHGDGTWSNGTGFQVATWFIISILEKNVDFAELVMTDTNYKDQLLRHFQQIYPSGVYPDWKVINVEGPSHNKVFTVSVFDIDGKKLGTGEGQSKKDAEQASSRQALIEMKVMEN